MIEKEQKRRDEESLLFAILTECLCHQVNMLDGLYKQNAKRLVNNLMNASRTTLRELHRDWPDSAEYAMGEFYDFFYMVLREASKVQTHEAEAFREHIAKFFKQQPAQENLAIFNPASA